MELSSDRRQAVDVLHKRVISGVDHGLSLGRRKIKYDREQARAEQDATGNGHSEET